MRRSWPVHPIRSPLLLLPLLLAACGDDAGEADVPEGPPPTRVEVTPLDENDLAGIEPDEVVLNLSWGARTVVRDPDPVAARASLTDVRVEEMNGFDRTVIEFDDDAPFPGYRVAWADSATTECGTEVATGGDSGVRPLVVRLRPAQVQDEGRPTLARTDHRAGFANLERARLLCGEGGMVEWLLTVRDSAQVRVLEMRDPARLVVDVRHGGAAAPPADTGTSAPPR